ncbi:MAG: hypothetical protein KatS3mg110_4128 [Pirellulaceae bacterium]|nr:MAG: hypothetical protein KatS3mg110_4128 [Pirellulaceae bacterium]
MIATAHQFAPVARETGQPIQLAMQKLWLGGRVTPCGAVLQVVHTFSSSEKRPLEVVYAFALPPDAAVRRFQIEGSGFRVKSDLRDVSEAEKQYEKALSEGHLGALVREYRDGIVNLSVGNLKPGELVTVRVEMIAGVESHDGGYRFTFPFTMAPCYHPKVRVGFDGQQGEMELPDDLFGDVLLPTWLTRDDGLHRIGFDLKVVTAGKQASVSCVSFPVEVSLLTSRQWRVRSRHESHLPKNDLVLEVSCPAPQSAWAACGTDSQGKGRFIAVVPSNCLEVTRSGVRRVVFVLDQSGSMNGRPLEQAKRAIAACIGALQSDDQFGLLSFHSVVVPFRKTISPAGNDVRQAALQFLDQIRATGGTELEPALQQAIKMLGESGGDIFLVTDGEVYQTEAIIQAVKDRAIRIHTLGIGAASQQRFLQQLARQTRAGSRFVQPSEPVDWATLALFQGVGRVVSLEIERLELPDGRSLTLEVPPPFGLQPGLPLVLYGWADPTVLATPPDKVDFVLTDGGRRTLAIEWDRQTTGEPLRLLTGARLIADVQAQMDVPPGDSKLARRTFDRLRRRCRELSETYGLASREMALVAVVERPSDRPGELPETRVVPVGWHQEKSLKAYFRHQAAIPDTGVDEDEGDLSVLYCYEKPWYLIEEFCAVDEDVDSEEIDLFLASSQWDASKAPDFSLRGTTDAHTPSEPVPTGVWQSLGSLLSDGGLPGDTTSDRIVRTAYLLLELLALEPAARRVFQLHLDRIVSFLRGHLGTLPAAQRTCIETLLRLCDEGRSLPGEWSTVPSDANLAWQKLQATIGA